ncbi:hypothetical protein Cni_G04215 [Canna indica]|uniref:Uncharacterized protein n=1 Tax=Canna indica TaxID=4628 RepID=A0AAQ3JSE1_9LILI|nr:hypothetical protein Cni_G04215 [Canna indica]
MNGGQAYGKGWMNGDCYVVHDGVFAGAAVLVVSMVALVLVFNFTKKERRVPTRLHGWNLEGAGNESTLAEKVTLAHLLQPLGLNENKLRSGTEASFLQLEHD